MPIKRNWQFFLLGLEMNWYSHIDYVEGEWLANVGRHQNLIKEALNSLYLLEHTRLPGHTGKYETIFSPSLYRARTQKILLQAPVPIKERICKRKDTTDIFFEKRATALFGTN